MNNEKVWYAIDWRSLKREKAESVEVPEDDLRLASGIRDDFELTAIDSTRTGMEPCRISKSTFDPK